jgi:hypothetical protein
MCGVQALRAFFCPAHPPTDRTFVRSVKDDSVQNLSIYRYDTSRLLSAAKKVLDYQRGDVETEFTIWLFRDMARC